MTQLQRENAEPNALIGDLTVELKKTTRCGDEAGDICKSQHAELSPFNLHPPHQSRPFLLGLLPRLGVCVLSQQMVTQKRISPLMKLHDLLVHPNLRLKASRVAHRRKPKPTGPNR